MSSLFLVPTGGGPIVTALGSTYTTKTDGADVSRSYSLMEEEFWGDTTPLHRHGDAEEAFYILDGAVELWADGRARLASTGDFVVVPRGVSHGLRRTSPRAVRMLTIVSPPGFEQFFGVVAERGESDLLAQPDRLVDLAARYGTEVLGDYPA